LFWLFLRAHSRIHPLRPVSLPSAPPHLPQTRPKHKKKAPLRGGQSLRPQQAVPSRPPESKSQKMPPPDILISFHPMTYIQYTGRKKARTDILDTGREGIKSQLL